MTPTDRRQTPSLILSAAALVLANLIPLYGAIFWGWSVFEIVLLYWAENVVAGLYAILRIFTAEQLPTVWGDFVAKSFVAAFFTFHYGMFCLVHGIFVLSLLGGNKGRLFDLSPVAILFTGTLKWALLALVASHGVAFLWNYLIKGDYRHTGIGKEMGAPYPRMVVLHIAILLGAFAIEAFGAQLVFLLILVVGKTVLDLKLHQRAHRQLHAAA